MMKEHVDTLAPARAFAFHFLRPEPIFWSLGVAFVISQAAAGAMLAGLGLTAQGPSERR